MSLDIDQLLKDFASEETLPAAGQDGLVVWWNLGPATDPEPLKRFSEQHFNSRRFNPKLRSWNECLHRALRLVAGFTTGKYMLQSCLLNKDAKELAAIEIRLIEKGVHENELPRVGRAHILEGATDGRIHAGIVYDGETMTEFREDLMEKIASLRAAMPAPTVGEWLVQVILDPLVGGSRLNAGGGNYFVPENSVHVLKEIQQVVTQAAAPQVIPGTVNRITASRIETTPELLADIHEGIRHQIDHQLEKVRECIGQGEPGMRALKNRQGQVERMLTHLQKYQHILDNADIAQIKQGIEECQIALGVEVARNQGRQAAACGDDSLEAMLGGM